MTQQDEWGPWIDHDGNGYTLSFGFIVEAESADGYRQVGRPKEGPTKSWGARNWWNWKTLLPDEFQTGRVIRYRIRKPRGMAILEDLLQDLPQDVDA